MCFTVIVHCLLKCMLIPHYCWHSFTVGANRSTEDRWHVTSSMVIREVTGLGCDLLRHLSSISQEPSHTCLRGGSCKSRGEEGSQVYQPSSWPSLCSRGSGDYGRHGFANTALFKGAWEKSKGPNWGETIPASKNAAAVQRRNAISIMSGLLEGAPDTIT